MHAMGRGYTMGSHVVGGRERFPKARTDHDIIGDKLLMVPKREMAALDERKHDS